MGKLLDIHRCPHCNVDIPNMPRLWAQTFKNPETNQTKHWAVYGCCRCQGAVLCGSDDAYNHITEQYPTTQSFQDPSVPKRAGQYLQQAYDSIHAPAGAVILAASSVDSMLKAKGYTQGRLFDRIDQAVRDHLITEDMGRWAHEVRLEANDQRHADDAADLPTQNDAKRIVEFAKALATFLFVLPSQVKAALQKKKAATVSPRPKPKPTPVPKPSKPSTPPRN